MVKSKAWVSLTLTSCRFYIYVIYAAAQGDRSLTSLPDFPEGPAGPRGPIGPCYKYKYGLIISDRHLIAPKKITKNSGLPSTALMPSTSSTKLANANSQVILIMGK